MSKTATFLTLIIPIVLFVIVRFIIGFDGLYGQDSYEYLRYAKALKEFLTTGTSPGDYVWPICYPLTGALLSFLIPDVGLCLQLISVLSASIVYVYVKKITCLIYPNQHKDTCIYFLILLLMSAFVLRFSISSMADMFALAVLLMGFYYIILFTTKKLVIYLCLGSFFCSLAFMSRYAAILIILPIAIYAVYNYFKTRLPVYFILLALMASFLPLIPHLLIRTSDSHSFIYHNWLINWSPVHFFQKDYTINDGGIQQNTVINILYSFGGLFHPRYFFVGIFITVIGFKKFRWQLELKIMLACVLLYMIFLAGIPYQNNRYLLLAFPFLLILYYHPTMYIVGLLRKKTKMVVISILIFFQLMLFGFSFKKVWDRSMLEKEIYSYLTKENMNNPIYTMDMDVCINGRGYLYPIYNIWKSYYKDVDTNAIVLFNTEVFPKQWAGRNPMKNWKHFNEAYQLKMIKEFNNGWKVYEFN